MSEIRPSATKMSDHSKAHVYRTDEKELLDINTISIENDVAFLFSTELACWAKYSLPEYQYPEFTWHLRFKSPIEESQYHRYNIESAYRRIRQANWLCMTFFVLSFMVQYKELFSYFVPILILLLLMGIISLIPHKFAPKNQYHRRALLSAFVFLGFITIMLNRYRLKFTLPPMSISVVNMYVTGIERLSLTQCLVQVVLYDLGVFVVSSFFEGILDAFYGSLIILVQGLCMVALSRYLIRDMRISFAKRMGLLFERQRAKEEHKRIKQIANCIVPASMVDGLCELVANKGDTDCSSRYYSSVRQYESGSYMFATITSPGLQSPDIDATQMVCAISVFVHIVDNLCHEYKVDRIKCIGPTVLIVSGIPNHNYYHRRNILSMSLALQRSIESIQSKHKLLQQAQIKIGIHTGPCLAGVIGLSLFSFDVWGDSINIASRLMSTCEPGMTQVSGDMMELENGYYYEGRGEVYLKGKGNMRSYYLVEEYNDIQRPPIVNPINQVAATNTDTPPDVSEIVKRELDTVSTNLITRKLQFRDKSMEDEYKTQTSYYRKDMMVSIGVVIVIVVFFVINEVVALERRHIWLFLIIRFVGQFVPLCLTVMALKLIKNQPTWMHFMFFAVIISTSASVLLKLYILRQDIDTSLSAYGTPRSAEYALYFYNIELVSLFSVLFMLPRANFWSTVGITALLFGMQQIIVVSMNKVFASNTLVSNVALFVLGVHICYSIEVQRRLVFALTRLICAETDSIDKQKVTTQRLILSVVPKQIYDRLTEDPSTFGIRHEQAVALFADIVGFTNLSGRISLSEMNELLNHILITFDRLCIRFKLQKLKSLGDCVVVVGGIYHNMEIAEEKPRLEEQIQSMLYLAEEAHNAAQRISIELRQDIKFRIGIASGRCVSGVIGSRKFCYDIWGEAINTANWMESTGTPGRTQVCEQIYEASRGYIFYDVEDREPGKRYFMLSSK